LLVTNSLPETPARIRLEAVASTLDGFELSKIDLEQRREGDVLGASQSGTRSHLRLLRVLRDEELIDSARQSAEKIIEADPSLAGFKILNDEIKFLETDSATDFIDKG
jgi:ATP-dependent DNA helicase RecG